MTTLTAADPACRSSISRRYLAAGTFILLGLIDIFVFGLFAHRGDAVFALSLSGATPSPAQRSTCPAALVVLRARRDLDRASGMLRAVVDVPALGQAAGHRASCCCASCSSLLCWADAGNAIGPLNVVNLLQSTLTASIPLVLGALAGCMCERSGVINIAIEGQLLLGAFAAAVVASAFGGLWLGLIGGSLAGGLLGALLAVFAITFLVDQIILGVVLNVLALGLTGYLYDRVSCPHPDLNTRQHVQRRSRSRCSATSRSSGRSSSTRRSSCTSRTR